MVQYMQIRVLGPLMVEDEETSYALGGPKQRTLLALLIAAHGASVSSDALVMGVYGSDANPKRLRSIQTYISTFRRSLGEIIETTADGYRLIIDPETIDAHRFEAAIRKARATLNAARSAEILRECLRLWRGRPYGDIEDSDLLRAEIRRLEELHAEALEARIDIDLGAGKHRQLLAELEHLVATYPAREGLRSRQMLALYRSGRQTDALHAYRQFERHLRDVYGLDTSRELRHLEEQLLDHDDALGYHPTPRARTEPSRYTSFIGRSDETSALVECLSRSRLVTITGPGGIGKTSLGHEVARALAETMTTVYVPIEAHRATEPLTLVAQSVGLVPGDRSDVLAMVGHALDGHPTLILFDGCEHVVDELPTVIHQLLGRCPSARVLITSRERLSIPGEDVFELGPLAHGRNSDSDRLFADRAGIALESLDDDARRSISQIGERLSGMPLALELAAARWGSVVPGELVERLDDQLNLLAARRWADPRHRSMIAALDWSYDHFSPHHQLAFRQLAVFRGDIHVAGAARVLGAEHPETILRDLADLSVLIAEPDDRFRMLEPVRQYAWSRLEDSGDLDATQMRHAAWIVTCCEWIEHEYNVARSSTALTVLRAEGPEIAAVASWALEQDRPEIVLSIVAAVGRIWWQALDPLLLNDIAVAALDHPAVPQGNLAIRALAHTAFLHRTTDKELTKELVRRLTSESRDVTDPPTRFIVLQMRALLSQHRAAVYGTSTHDSTIVERLALFDESVGVARELEHPIEPEFYNRAYLLEALRRFDEADEGLETLLEWAGDSNPTDRGAALIRLAMSNLRRSSHLQAVNMAREASRLLLDTGQLSIAADAEWVRSYGHFYLGQYDKGLRALRRGDALYRQVGMPPAAVWNPVHVAMFAAALERWSEVETALGDYVETVPTQEGEAARQSFLLGHPSIGSKFIRSLYPAARWLMAKGRRSEAAHIVAAAPGVQALTGLSYWDLEVVVALADELSDYPVDGHPETLGDLFIYIAQRFGSGASAAA
jgi:predicted ATPase/DNA-binding SARP family transcriptional activator